MSSNYQITHHLKSNEVACPCCGQVEFHRPFVDKLELVRLEVGLEFHYTSFFRCNFHNDSLPNSAKYSYHTLGRAADIDWRLWSSEKRWRFIFAAMKVGLTVIPYSAHCHVDNRDVPIFLIGSY